MTINESGPVRRLIALAGLTLLMSGCATVQRDAAFPEVSNLVADRLGQKIEWIPDGYPAAQARDATRQLIRNELTADAAVKLALLNNRRLQATLQDLGVAQADLVEAGLLENPVFGAGALFKDAGTELDLDIVQNFLGVFTLSARRKIGRASADRATLDVSRSVIELAADVQEQYYRVVGDAEALALARQVVVATEAAAEIAQRQYAAGNLSKREQSLQQAFYAQTLLEVAQAEAQLESDREKLTRLMGLWGEDTAWKIPERLPAVPDVLPDLARLEKLAVSRRLDMAAAKKQVEAVDQALHLARQIRWLGPLGIGVQFNRDADGEKSYGPRLELGVPVFDRGQTRIARLESERRRSEDLVAALAVDIRSEAREIRSRLVASHQFVRHYERALLPLQQTIVSETLKFYNGMLVGVYDLLLASQSQIQTGRQYIAANRDFWLAWIDLERAVGGRIPSVQSPVMPGKPPENESGATAPEGDAYQHGDKSS